MDHHVTWPPAIVVAIPTVPTRRAAPLAAILTQWRALGAEPVVHHQDPSLPIGHESHRRTCDLLLQGILDHHPDATHVLLAEDDVDLHPDLRDVLPMAMSCDVAALMVNGTRFYPQWVKDLNVGTYTNLCTARMDTPAMDVIHMLVKRNISCVPVLDRDGTVLNVFEAVDVIALIKGGDYDNLNLSVGKALEKRSEVSLVHPSPFLISLSIQEGIDTNPTVRKGFSRHLHVHAQRPHGHDFRHDPKVTRASAGCD